MKKRVLSLVMALVLCLGLLPTAAFAADSKPDWYFLFAIFKNVDADCKDKDGKVIHTKYSMTQDEIDFVKEDAKSFEAYMNSVGVMRAHVDVVEIDTTIKELENYDDGGFLSPKQAEPLLKRNVDLDKYDHVTCAYSLNIHTGYLGRGGSTYENGTGHTGINLVNQEYCLNTLRSTENNFPASMYVHEFLHFMESMNKKWGVEFNLHKGGEVYNTQSVDNWKGYYTDVILNQAKGTAETGTGVTPVAWQYPPHTLRSSNSWTIPSGITNIVDWEFGNRTTLTKVTIPASVTSIGYAAFWNTGIKDVYYGGTEAQWKAIKIGEYNDALTKATIHYNSAPSTTTPTITVEKIPAKGTAYASTQSVTVDGKKIEFQMYALKDANGNLTNYIKLRDMAYVLNGTKAQFAVGYNGTISLTTGQAYQAGGTEMTTPYSGDRAYQGGAQTVKINSSNVAMTAITLTDSNGGAYNYFKLRDLGKALGFYVGYSNEAGIYIDSTKPYSE